MHAFVRNHLLYRYWSPQQIAAKLRVMHPEDLAQWVSHETIYALSKMDECGAESALMSFTRQWFAASVLAERHRFVQCLADRSERHCQATQRPATRHA